MGFDLFNQEDPRDWDQDRRRDEFDRFQRNRVIGPHCQTCQYDPAPVIQRGNLTAELMVVGDYTAPADRRTDRPFSGPAGRLLRRMLAAIDLHWENDCYITNALLCDGTDEPPRAASVRACRTNLLAQIDLVQPRVVLAAGSHPLQSLFRVPVSDPLSDHLGHKGPLPNYPGIHGVVTYNPAYVLRQRSDPSSYRAVRETVWAHLQTVRDLMAQG